MIKRYSFFAYESCRSFQFFTLHKQESILFKIKTKVLGIILPVCHYCIAGHNRRWVDGLITIRSIPILSINTIGNADHQQCRSIDHDFLFLIDSINHLSQNPCQTDDNESIGSHSTDGIALVKNQFPCPHFSKNRPR